MIYGIEQTTDVAAPETKVERFAAWPAAFAWLDDAGSRREVVTRELFDMPRGWRPPSAAALERMSVGASTRAFPRTSADMLAAICWRDGARAE